MFGHQNRPAAVLLLAALVSVAACGSQSPSLAMRRVRWHHNTYTVSGNLPDSAVGRPLGHLSLTGVGPFIVHAVTHMGGTISGEIALVPTSGRPHVAVEDGTVGHMTTWSVGRFTVKEIPLPKAYFRPGADGDVLGTDYLQVSGDGSAGYRVTATSLLTGHSVSMSVGQCATEPSWPASTSLPSSEVPLLCQKTTPASRLLLLHLAAGIVGATALYLPVRPSTGDGYGLSALAFNSSQGEAVLWNVSGATQPIGSGLTNLLSGQTIPVPAAFDRSLLVSPNGNLYGLGTHGDLEKWIGGAWQDMGKLATAEDVRAVADDGSVWALSFGSGTTTVVHETPGSLAPASWRVTGSEWVLGAGYVVTTAGEGTPFVRLSFPLAKKTLRFGPTTGRLGEGNAAGPLPPVIFQTPGGGGDAIEVSVRGQ